MCHCSHPRPCTRPAMLTLPAPPEHPAYGIARPKRARPQREGNTTGADTAIQTNRRPTHRTRPTQKNRTTEDTRTCPPPDLAHGYAPTKEHPHAENLPIETNTGFHQREKSTEADTGSVYRRTTTHSATGIAIQFFPRSTFGHYPRSSPLSHHPIPHRKLSLRGFSFGERLRHRVVPVCRRCIHWMWRSSFGVHFRMKQN